jgi:phospholipid-binding lipoprotein MlaA
MKSYFFFIFFLIFSAAGYAHQTNTPVHLSAADVSKPVITVVVSDPDAASSGVHVDEPMDDAYGDYGDFEEDDYVHPDTQIPEHKLTIADPLEPFNRVMHQFNDKLYFWALKPAARGYKAVVPEPGRLGVKNFFFNLAFPARFLSCLLQADFSGAAAEAGRFTINTVWGVGGFLDPSSQEKLNLQKQETDLGQTMGVWGIGHGFYIVWPVFGPSSPRDSVTIAGDYFLYPVSYIRPWYAATGVRAFEEINATSLRLGDYEALKGAAIDPYIAFRDAYVQYRYNRVKSRQAKIASSFQPPETTPSDEPATGKDP